MGKRQLARGALDTRANKFAHATQSIYATFLGTPHAFRSASFSPRGRWASNISERVNHKRRRMERSLAEIESVQERDNYYVDALSADRLRQCYDVAPPRVRRYFETELQFVLDAIGPRDAILELGCGYGRVLKRLAEKARCVVGVDISPSSVALATRELNPCRHCHLAVMDAATLAFDRNTFDVVACIQNGISAFKKDCLELMRESLRVTKPGGTVLFSSYAARFWPDRLAWFEH